MPPIEYLRAASRLFNAGDYPKAAKYMKAAHDYRDQLSADEQTMLDAYRKALVQVAPQLATRSAPTGPTVPANGPKSPSTPSFDPAVAQTSTAVTTPAPSVAAPSAPDPAAVGKATGESIFSTYVPQDPRNRGFPPSGGAASTNPLFDPMKSLPPEVEGLEARQRGSVMGRTFGALRGRFKGAEPPKMVYSADGRILASSAGDVGEITFWDTATMRRIGALTPTAGRRKGLVFSPDSRQAIVLTSQAVISHDLTDGIRSWTIECRPVSVSFSPDGKLISIATAGGDIQVCDAVTGLMQGVLPAESGPRP